MKFTGKVISVGIVTAVLILGIIGTMALSANNPVREKGLWSDATDVLSKEAAQQVGRAPVAPLINTEQGNMLVFFFCLGGIVAGFTIGYYWRRILIEGR